MCSGPVQNLSYNKGLTATGGGGWLGEKGVYQHFERRNSPITIPESPRISPESKRRRFHFSRRVRSRLPAGSLVRTPGVADNREVCGAGTSGVRHHTNSCFGRRPPRHARSSTG